ncbi:MAG TPA: BNR repeat-containing protein [Propionibacteriaceae bacterium]|nr:BNR repeat-containing protein [Propionibacteriaceae bacterium]
MEYSSTSRRARVVVRLLALVLVMSALVLAGPRRADAATVTAADTFERADGTLGSSWASNRGTWSIANGAALSTSATGNAVATYTPLALGDDYAVSARINIVTTGTPGGAEWVGVAGNVQGTSASALNYYLLRVTTGSGTGTNGRWQLLRMSNSTSTGLLASGTIVAAYGTQLDLALTRTGNTLRSQIINATSGATLADQTYTTAVADPQVSGGRAGLYSNSGNLRAQTWNLSTTTPAASPPGALNCAPGGESYTYPDSAQTVISTSTVGSTWAGMPVTQRILTSGNDQYVAYYDVNRGLTVAKHTIGGAWSYKTLPSTLGWDSHNYVSMGLDRSGNLHVSGNMHNVPLVYFRTTTPGDISTLVKVDNMVSASTETSVTYPEFVNRSDGSLVFSHRSGGSGDGVTYFNVYDESTSSWSRLVSQPIFDGNGSASNPSGTWSSYFEGPKKGPDGWFHMIWVWRDTGDAATNSMLTYAKSQDLVNWVTNNGTPLTTPLKYGQGDVIDPVPDHGGLLNNNVKIGFDSAGKVLITYHKYDAQGRSQVYAARPTATGTWQISQITNWTGRWSFGGFGSIDFQVAIQGSSVLSNGNISVDFFCNGSGNKQSIIIDSSLNRIAQVPTQPLPASVTTVTGTFPGLQVNIQNDLAGATAGGQYILRWEALPHNADQPRTSYPTGGSALQVILLD